MEVNTRKKINRVESVCLSTWGWGRVRVYSGRQKRGDDYFQKLADSLFDSERQDFGVV